MPLPRFTVKGVMAAVLVVAINCMTIRSVDVRRHEALVFFLIVVGSLPMGNILGISLAILVRRGSCRRPFWLGFEVCGSLAYLANLAITIVEPKGMLDRLGLCEPFFTFVGARLGVTASPAWEPFEQFVMLPMVWLLPQLIIALLGGLLWRWLRRNSSGSPTAAPITRGRSWVALVVSALLISFPAIAIEAVQHWEIRPKIARLEKGSEAVVKLEIVQTLWVSSYACLGTAFKVREGTRVRVEEDSDPSQTGAIKSEKGEVVGDFREVQIKLLDGDFAGQRTTLGRCLLRPDW